MKYTVKVIIKNVRYWPNTLFFLEQEEWGNIQHRLIFPLQLLQFSVGLLFFWVGLEGNSNPFFSK